MASILRAALFSPAGQSTLQAVHGPAFACTLQSGICQRLFSSSTSTIDITQHPGYSIITLNQPRSLNALSERTMAEVTDALTAMDRDEKVKCIIIASSSTKAFAAGADIKEMAGQSYTSMHARQYFKGWGVLRDVRKPIVAAVNGYALGGGFELALMCDILVASEDAQFGLPEITLGVIPGIGGTQRLTRAVGKAKAMDMLLTGSRMSAAEALQRGVASRVVPKEQLLAEAQAIAAKIASFSAPAVAKAKQCVDQAQQLPLDAGVQLERELFWSCFATEDQKEGMAAFVEKRPPRFRDA